MKLSVFLFLLCGWWLLGFVEMAHAQTPLYDEAGRTYKTHSWSFDVQSTYYEATANYNRTGGEYISLPDGYRYNVLDFDFGARFVPSPDWALYATAQVSNAESSNKVDVRRNSSFSKAVFGTDFRVHSGKTFEFYPDISLTVPFERIDATADQVLNREGAIELSSRLISRWNWSSFKPYGFIGFTFRDEGRSSLMPYGTGLEIQFQSWDLGGELRGYQTVIQDKFTDTPHEREVVGPRNGNALRFFAVNPSLLETNFWGRFRFSENWGLKLGGGISLTGAATSAGWNALASLNYFVPSSHVPRSRTLVPAPPIESEERFREETNDGVDQNLFRRPAHPPPPPPAPPDPRAVQKSKVQKELDQTEFQIELKSDKPKRKKRK